MLGDALGCLAEGRILPAELMRASMTAIMQGQAEEVELAAFLTGLRVRGETPDELAAAVAVLREHMTPLDAAGLDVVDTCGTGGDALGTFNISTAAALVVAGCGVVVVKHGNRGVSSASGSADVLTALGVQIDLEPAAVARCLHEVGFAFCFAPRFHPAMRHVAAVRKKLRFRTIFNLMGPLCNPAGARRQLLGVGRPGHLDLLAECLSRLGAQNAYLVHGEDGLDEVSLAAPTLVRHVESGQTSVETWRPEDFGLPRGDLAALRVDGPVESAAMVTRVLHNDQGPPRDVVLANAAAALLACRRVRTLPEGVQLAATALREGAPRRVLERLIAISQAP